MLRNLGFVFFISVLCATSLGLVKSRWPNLVRASLELAVEDKGRRNRLVGLNALMSLSLSVKDESPRDGIRNLPLTDAFLLLVFAETPSMLCPVIKASFSSGVKGK